MALSFRLRRALTLSSLLKDRHFSPISSSSPPFLSHPKPLSPLVGNPNPRSPHSLIQSQLFRSSPSSDRRFDGGFEDSKIGPDEILFEGCDYNHWLITIDFPKGENKPTPEQMVETYVQTAARVFGSVEEAKKRIYACSTTTYEGFQVICDEATSEKFRDLPGVVFILPDSYIDPLNKQYGGDKYDNGIITPRPPPIQYGRQGYGDRNRNNDNRPRYDRPRSTMPPQQDGRGFGPPQQDRRGYGPPQPNRPPQQDRMGYGQGERRDYGQAGGQMPPYQGGFGQGQQGNPPPQGQVNYSEGPRGDYRSGPAEHRQPSPGYSGNYGQGSGPGVSGEFGQAPGTGYNNDYRQ